LTIIDKKGLNSLNFNNKRVKFCSNKPVFQFIVVLERRLLIEEARKTSKTRKNYNVKKNIYEKPKNPQIPKTQSKMAKTHKPNYSN
jgi:uncharacterized pyridoxamine 5'-phosphate oxidase family protein